LNRRLQADRLKSNLLSAQPGSNAAHHLEQVATCCQGQFGSISPATRESLGSAEQRRGSVG
jgi:hypothetical protein